MTTSDDTAAVLTEAALITKTTELAQKVGNGATEVKDIVTEVTELSKTVLLELAGCGEKQASETAVALHNSLQDVKQQEQLLKYCLKLKYGWDEYNSKIKSIIESKGFEEADFADLIRLLHRMTKCAGKCMGEYQIFTEKLSSALEICIRAMGQFENMSNSRKADASTGRWVGYGAAVATFVTGAVACGILTVGTGGAAAPFLAGAMTAAVAAGTAGVTYAVTEKMENIGRQLQLSAKKLSSVELKLKAAGKGITKLKKVTEHMAKNLENALTLQILRQCDKKKMEQEILEKDEKLLEKDEKLLEKDEKLLEKDEKIRELEAKLRTLENP